MHTTSTHNHMQPRPPKPPPPRPPKPPPPPPTHSYAPTREAAMAPFAQDELISAHGADYAMPNLLNHLAAPSCSRLGWHRRASGVCAGVYSSSGQPCPLSAATRKSFARECRARHSAGRGASVRQIADLGTWCGGTRWLKLCRDISLF
jgi:hypothetical protein